LKRKKRKKRKISKHNVYHVPDIHTLEWFRRVEPEIKEILPVVRAIFLEAGDVEIEKIPAMELFANDLSVGKASTLEHFARSRPDKPDKDSLLLQIISGIRKKIYYERPSETSKEMSNEVDLLNKRWKDLFSSGHYKEAMEVFWEVGMLWKKLMEKTDKDISRELDRIIGITMGGVLLFLGADHQPSPQRGSMVRSIPLSDSPMSFLRVVQEAERVGGDVREAILLRKMIEEPLGLYWILKGDDPLIASERIIPMLRPLGLGELKELYEFMTDALQTYEIPARGITWLKEHGLIS